MPPEFQAAIAGIKRTPANNSRALLAALQPLVDLGLSEQEAIAAGFGHFPIAGAATYSHDWWFPRFVPTFHLHQGTDIFAPMGTPVRSPVAGTLRQTNGAVGGLSAYVTQADGTYFYLAHLSSFVAGQATGQAVRQGEVIGFVGDTGNARGGAPHVHFEIHPAPVKVVTTGKGKKAVSKYMTVPVPPGTQLPPTDPKPYLDYWISEAMAAIPSLIAQLEASRPRAVIATGLTRRLADGTGSGGVFTAPTGPPRSQLLWASSASPAGGTLRFAEAQASAATGDVGYAALARRQERRLQAWAQSDARARAILAPLTPPALRPALGWGSSPQARPSGT